MNFRISLVAALLLGAISASTAQAVDLFIDTFEYADQAAFNAAWTPIGCTGQGTPCTGNVSTNGGTLSTDTAVSPTHSILNVSPAAPSPGTADFAQRNKRTFTATPTLAIGDILRWSFNFYDLAPTVSPYRQFANMQSSEAVSASPAGQLVSMGLNNNQTGTASGGQYYMARILGYTVPTTADPDGGPTETVGGAGAYFKLNDFDPTPSDTVADGPGARSEGWHNLRVDISTANGTDTDFNFYVDGVLAEHVKAVGSSPRVYNHFRMGAGVSSTQDAYYDDFKLEYIPFVAPPSNNGDFNDDGTVDAADYVIWRKYHPLATGGTQNNGDADGDGDVDMADFTKWQNQYGTSPAGSGGQGAVPEPTAIVMIMLGLASFIARRGR